MPSQAHQTDAGFDLFSNEHVELPAGGQMLVKTGYIFEFPEGYYAQIYPRSGLGARGIDAFVGTIDNGYRGEIMVVLRNFSK
jgi:dUTP pyrophosphatase